jgi:hypothetical protein
MTTNAINKPSCRVIKFLKFIAYDKDEFKLYGNKATPVLDINEIIVRLFCDDKKIKFNELWSCEEVFFDILKMAPKSFKKDLEFIKTTEEIDVDTL